ncbi:type VII secretion protein EccB [Actinokineospora sp. UTMC 2448]|uniref:type VII secretion protein EccB n=1 Tax=Actinokineospora sp. UTMC 2448 TaxID=2268449 RepID=UPI00216446C2|nr:type VII secretion protein EccB [Actinokineospora sp. UTMC 2448]UVS79701.1 Type VII secretion system protein eccB1 [Actinokineospora sp. UTMC 2448]
MYSRREQVQAHSFLVGRLIAALLRADPDAPDRPLRRTTVGVAGGIAVAALVAAGVLVVALLTGRGGDDWRKPGTLVVDEGTGNRYLLIDGRLRPVLNYASARLLIGGDLKVAQVGSDALAGTPHGSPIGILGAPDSVPAPSAPQPWLVCSDPEVTLTIGATPGVVTAPEGEALLVTAGDELYLAWRDRRLRVTAPWAPRAIGLDPATAVPVDPAWLNALPSGPDLGPPPLPSGGPGPLVAGLPTTVGQLVSVPDAVGGGRYVVRAEGLVPVTATVAALLRADPDRGGPPDLRITPAQLAQQTVLPAPVWQAELPPEPPVPLRVDDRAPCVLWSDDTAALVSAPPPAAEAPSAGLVRDGRVADRIAVAPGAGLLARTRPAPGVPGAGAYLVTESGAKFPVASAEAAAALGLPIDTARLVPADLLALLPTGPVLDRIG